MVHQAEVNTNGTAKRAAPNVRESFSGLAHDAIELAELQTRLLKLDAQAAARNGGTSLVLGVLGVCLLLGCVPVALVALGELFVAQFEWTRAASYAAAAAIGLALSAGAGFAAWRRIRSATKALQRSRDELNRNIAWIKSNLKRGEKSPRYANHLD
jgi:Putative Actinobacterial Holin-X, holin superfamily III